MPRTEEQFTEIRETRRKEILDAALEVFSEVGYHKASINNIAKRAKISKGLIYNYFESKEQIIKEITVAGMSQFMKIFDPNKDGILTEEEFRFFIDKTFEIIDDDLRYWKVYFGIIVQADVMQIVFEDVMRVLIPFMETMTKYYAEKGVKNPEAYARLFGAMFDGITLNYAYDKENFPIEAVKEIMIEKFK